MTSEGQSLLQCYNRGCGRSFSSDENGPDACSHHPGAPVFHDAYKGWSCCKKRTTDFTEFLNIPGCSRSKHNPEKPVEEPKSKPETEDFQEVVRAPTQRAPITEPEERPSEDEPMTRLPVNVAASLKAALAKLALTTNTDQGPQLDGSEIKVGTLCQNKGCQKPYEGESSHTKKCQYHPGAAIFHEGMKYWSCCKRKTTDFNNFLNQEGCTFGGHAFSTVADAEKKRVECRHDWHQTGPLAVLSIYCKKADPNMTIIEANQVCLSVRVTFDQGRSEFCKRMTLEGVIDPSRSTVNMLGTKVEIKLRKLENFSWKKFEI